MLAGNIIGTGAYKPDYTPAEHEPANRQNITPFWMIGGAGAEVEVDTETGHVRILKLVNVIDCGTLINPRIVETQISGAALMQLGFTMFEKIISMPDGSTMPRSRITDTGSRHPRGDRGGRRLSAQRTVRRQRCGKSATLCVSPAIANAIDDAVGVRLMELPLSPEAVLRALRIKAAAPLEEA